MSNPLLARFASRPSLVAPEAREWFEGCLAAVAGHPRAAEMLNEIAATDDGFWPAADDWRAALRPYVVRDGVLQIPVKGVLLHDFSFALGSWATGYVYIRRAFERGMADPDVRGIALVCDSPGGHVAGNFELVDRIFTARGTKPIRAFAHESAYSAAYSIASAADRIVVSRTGGVGSIGVVAAHLSVAGAMEQAGLKVTFIYAGRHKVDGNPYEDLPDDVKARFQARIDELYGVFVAAVVRNRGLTEQAVRATEALTYSATEAVNQVGLADEIGALDDAVAAFAADCDSPQDEDTDNMITPEAHEAAVAAARADGETTGHAAGATAERTRVKAILGAEEAKGREPQAAHLAHETDMTAEAAVALLATLPKAAPASATNGNRFDAAMAAAGNPRVGLDAPTADADDGEAFAEAYFTAKRQKRSA